MKILIFLILFNFCFQAKSYLYANELITGSVFKVSDGDTLIIKSKNNKKIKVRLAGIDAPELNQPFGIKSKELLVNFLNKKIKLKVLSKDRYKRTVGIVYYKDQDINIYMLENGAVWAYRKYLYQLPISTKKKYLSLERFSRNNKFGLWRDSNPIPPWKWRKQKKQ